MDARHHLRHQHRVSDPRRLAVLAGVARAGSHASGNRSWGDRSKTSSEGVQHLRAERWSLSQGAHPTCKSLQRGAGELEKGAKGPVKSRILPKITGWNREKTGNLRVDRTLPPSLCSSLTWARTLARLRTRADHLAFLILLKLHAFYFCKERHVLS
jgi:hypothetical protein